MSEQLEITSFKELATVIKGGKPKDYSRQTYALAFFENDMKALELDIFLYMINQLPSSLNINKYSIADLVITLPVNLIWQRDQFNYTRLRTACMNLRKQSITVDNQKTGKGITANLFSSVAWDSNEGLIYVEINRRLQPIFLELKNGYSDYVFHETRLLRTVAQKKLYIMFGAYYKRKINKFEIELNELNQKLNLKYHNRNSQFIKRVIEPTVNSINKQSKIMRVKYKVNPGSSKGNGTIVFIPYALGAESNGKYDPYTFNAKEIKAYNYMLNYGVASKLAAKIAKDNTLEFYRINNRYLENKGTNTHKEIKNPGAFIVKELGYAK